MYPWKDKHPDGYIRLIC